MKLANPVLSHEPCLQNHYSVNLTGSLFCLD